MARGDGKYFIVEIDFFDGPIFQPLSPAVKILYLWLWKESLKRRSSILSQLSHNYIATMAGLYRHPIATYLRLLHDCCLISVLSKEIVVYGVKQKHPRFLTLKDDIGFHKCTVQVPYGTGTVRDLSRNNFKKGGELEHEHELEHEQKEKKRKEKKEPAAWPPESDLKKKEKKPEKDQFAKHKKWIFDCIKEDFEKLIPSWNGFNPYEWVARELRERPFIESPWWLYSVIKLHVIKGRVPTYESCNGMLKDREHYIGAFNHHSLARQRQMIMTEQPPDPDLRIVDESTNL